MKRVTISQAAAKAIAERLARQNVQVFRGDKAVTYSQAAAKAIAAGLKRRPQK